MRRAALACLIGVVVLLALGAAAPDVLRAEFETLVKRVAAIEATAKARAIQEAKGNEAEAITAYHAATAVTERFKKLEARVEALEAANKVRLPGMEYPDMSALAKDMPGCWELSGQVGTIEQQVPMLLFNNGTVRTAAFPPFAAEAYGKWTATGGAITLRLPTRLRNQSRPGPDWVGVFDEMTNEKTLMLTGTHEGGKVQLKRLTEVPKCLSDPVRRP